MFRQMMDNSGRSMNESEFHHVSFEPSTHLFQWSEACSSAKVICRVEIPPDLRKPFASENFVKLNIKRCE